MVPARAACRGWCVELLQTVVIPLGLEGQDLAIAAHEHVRRGRDALRGCPLPTAPLALACCACADSAVPSRSKAASKEPDFRITIGRDMDIISVFMAEQHPRAGGTTSPSGPGPVSTSSWWLTWLTIQQTGSHRGHNIGTEHERIISNERRHNRIETGRSDFSQTRFSSAQFLVRLKSDLPNSGPAHLSRLSMLGPIV